MAKLSKSNVPIEEQCVLATELKEQPGEVPEVHKLAFVCHGENESSILVHPDAVAAKFTDRAIAESRVALTVDQKQRAGLDGPEIRARGAFLPRGAGADERRFPEATDAVRFEKKVTGSVC